MTIKAIAYYRVSTAKQGASGLGLDAQRAAVEAFCTARGYDLIAPPFVEIESGSRNDRPQLLAAIDHCLVTGAKLVVAKLDRLGRNLWFVTTLQEKGVKFVAVDNPEANELTIHLMVAFAQHEREMISARTKAALQAAKARGQNLGNPNGADAFRRAGKGNQAALEVVSANADANAQRLAKTISKLRAEGAQSLHQLAKGLNAMGATTPRGGRWHPSSVRNLLVRLPA